MDIEQISDVLPRWAKGQATLKEIKGYSDDELFAIAHTAYFFLMQGKNNDARTIFEGLVAVDPRNGYYYRALGVIFYKMGDAERAVRQFGYAIRVNPDLPHAYVNRAEVNVALGDREKAAKDLRQALKLVGPKEPHLARKIRALLQALGG